MNTDGTASESNWIADEFASLVEVARIHHQNFAFFQKLIWPAVLFAAVILQLSMWQSTEMNRAIPGIYGHTSGIFASAAVRLFGFFADWLFYCFAFAGTAIAVRAFVNGENPKPEESLNFVRAAFGRFFSWRSCFSSSLSLCVVALDLSLARSQFCATDWVFRTLQLLDLLSSGEQYFSD